MEPYLGEIRLFSFSRVPNGWRLCDGSLLPVSTNVALFSLLSNQYGGDGKVNFALPDLRGRTPVGTNHTPGDYQQGVKGGVETVTLNTTQIGAHNHTLNANTTVGNKTGPLGRLLATNSSENTYVAAVPNTALIPASLDSAGGNAAHNNVQPSLVLNYCIATTGLYPQRP